MRECELAGLTRRVHPITIRSLAGIMVGLGIGLIMFGCYVVGKESKQGPRRLGGGPRPRRGVTSSRVPLVDSTAMAVCCGGGGGEGMWMWMWVVKRRVMTD